jgi:hypothetical protein
MRCVMWGRTYARQQRAREARRAEARASTVGANSSAHKEGTAKCYRCFCGPPIHKAQK